MKKAHIIFLAICMSITFSSCCMMMSERMSSTKQEVHNHNGSEVLIDPVCGNQVGKESSFTFEYKGAIYYFDTEQCLTVFKSNPDHFLQKKSEKNHHKTWKKVGMIGGAVVMSAMMVFMIFNVL